MLGAGRAHLIKLCFPEPISDLRMFFNFQLLIFDIVISELSLMIMLTLGLIYLDVTHLLDRSSTHNCKSYCEHLNLLSHNYLYYLQVFY